MRFSSFGTAVFAVGLGTLSFLTTSGCESSNNGKVVDRDQHQQTNPDGSETRTRSQVRETASGETVKETETQHREVVK
jgi:hypothetical protein